MIRLDMTGMDAAIRAIQNGEKHARFVTMRAMNDVAFTIMREGRARMQQIFDRPTNYTTKSWFVRKKADKKDLTAAVGMTDYMSDKRGTGPDRKLWQHFAGGKRSRKGLEMRLQAKKWLGSSEYLVQGEGARVDTFGNMSRGQVAQIFSQLQLQTESGYQSKPTGSKRSKANVKKAGKIFWSKGSGYWRDGQRKNNLPKGVWMRDSSGLHCLLLAVSNVRYRKRFDLDKFGAFIVKRDMDELFAKYWKQALATAR